MLDTIFITLTSVLRILHLYGMLWKRPDSVPVGQVWRRFQRNKDGAQINYQIRDVREEDKEKAIVFMEQIFLRDEPICQALDIKSDEESLQSIRENWSQILEVNISQACYLEDDKGEPKELAGFNMCLVKSKDDSEEDIEEVKGASWKKLCTIFMMAENKCDIFKYYDVDKYMTTSGLTLLPEHRGMGIGIELYKAREPLCRALNIHAMSTIMTAISSQTVAERCGYQTISELHLSELLEHGIDLSNCPVKVAKQMGIKFAF